MFDLLKMNGNPRRIVWSGPTLNDPSLPALKLSPTELVMTPEAKFTAAYAAR